jgi:hypothetical protein
MDVCVCVYSVFVFFCVQVAALRQADPPSKESYRLRMDYETEKAAKVHKGCTAMDSLVGITAMLLYMNGRQSAV